MGYLMKFQIFFLHITTKSVRTKNTCNLVVISLVTKINIRKSVSNCVFYYHFCTDKRGERYFFCEEFSLLKYKFRGYGFPINSDYSNKIITHHITRCLYTYTQYSIGTSI